jgi:intein/homing endonuclease
MGIKHFFGWFKKNFGRNIKNLRKKQNFGDINVSIDNLMIDLNGLFHSSAQKVYEYGSHKPPARLLSRPNKNNQMGRIEREIKVFEDICQTIDNILLLVAPKKRLILCVDGPAPLSKQNQQRQRRFRSSSEKGDGEKNNFDGNCITGDTLVSIHADRCRPIKMLDNNNIKVVSLSEEFKSTEYTEQTHFYNQGKKDIITITFQDGRTLSCTPDHRIMTDKGWIEARNLKFNEKVVFGIRGAIDIPGDDEKNYTLTVGNFDFTMETDNNREKLLAFSRIIGILLSDGCSAEYMRKSTGKKEPYSCVTLGSIPDVQILLTDIEMLTGSKMSTTYDEKRSFKVNLPARLSKAINSTGIPLGKRINQNMSFPLFILDKNCPVSVVREFLGGYFGGDGHSAGFGKTSGRYVVRNIKFSHSCKEEFKNNMIEHMNILTKLLEKCGVESTVGAPQYVYKSSKTGYKNNGDYNIIVNVKSTEDFIDKIGFRYCHSKSIRSEAMASYFKLRTIIQNNREEIISKALKKFNIEKKDRKNSYDESVFEFTSEHVVIHPYCIPSYQSFGTSIRNGIPGKLDYIRGLSMKTYLESIDSLRFFGDHTGGTDRVENTPVMYMKVISSKIAESACTYDISVMSKSSSFMANGIGVHNCMTPGTKFMDCLTKYIDWHIKSNITVNPSWSHLEVVFSNEKAPGEGEHKILNYIRRYGNQHDNYCIHGLDADLIMLALGTHLPNFWILREDLYDPRNEFYVLDIGATHVDLAKLMNWNESEQEQGSLREQKKDEEIQKFISKSAVNDFIFICFMVGNDFLPHIPSLEIIEGGIDQMLDVYKNVGERYGHLTHIVNDCVIFQKTSLEVFLGTIAQYDKGILEDKLLHKDRFFPDLLLEKNAKLNEGKYTLNIEEYRKDYYASCFEKVNIRDLCHEYLVGMQWVLSYYTRGVPDWKWCFKHHYAPFAHELAEHITDFKFSEKRQTEPTTPFQQLLSVLPPESAGLIPVPLSQLLTDSKSRIKNFCPKKFTVDLSGKMKEWEGIVLLPMVDFAIVMEEYFKHIDKVSKLDLERNILGSSYLYTKSPNETEAFRSSYGDILHCKVKTMIIDI